MSNKLLKFFFILFFLFLFSKGWSQILIDTTTYKYKDEFNGNERCIENYKIINNTNEDYLTWISLKSIAGKPEQWIIHRFLKNQIGDYNLMFMIYNGLLSQQYTNRIGTTFMKNIRPHKSFVYVIIKNKKNSLFYENRVAIVKRKSVEEYLQKKLDDNVFSPMDCIPLIEK